MRILFFVEPFPIRNSMTSYAWVLEKAGSLAWQSVYAHNGPELRIYANRQSLEAVERLPKGVVMEPTDREQRFFEDYFLDWQNQGLDNWVQLLSGDGDFVSAYIDILSSLHDRYSFDVIVHWGDNGAIEKFCHSSGVCRIAMELGCTRPPYMNSLCFDPFGVNGSAAPARVSISDLEALTRYKELSSADLLAQGGPNVCAAYEQNFAYDSNDVFAHLAHDQRPAVLIPLQLHDDANLLRYSPYNSPAEFLQDCLPKVIDAGYVAIISPHPHWSGRPGGMTAQYEARTVAEAFESSIVWLSGRRPNASLFAHSDFVLTINSSVGFEALLHDKEVILAGDAMYKPKEAFPSLDDYLNGSFDLNDYLRNVRTIRDVFLNGYLSPFDVGWQWTEFLARIQSVIDGDQRPEPSALSVIESLYGRFARSQEDYRYQQWLDKLSVN